jgi:hypothetical protein
MPPQDDSATGAFAGRQEPGFSFGFDSQVFLRSFLELADPSLSVPGKFQQKLPLMTAMSQVPNLPSRLMSMSPGHNTFP